ncbi:22408_t:CDS:2 [Entrophospora sp. SA101]|nr:22408_t:CDS:2 [Entrophospora sp. SA101]
MPLKKDRSRRNLDQNRSEICEADISRHNGGYRHSSSLMEIIVSVVRCRDVLERETSSPVAIKTTSRSIITDNGKIYNFDKVFDKAANQEILYKIFSKLILLLNHSTKKRSHKKTNRSRQNGDILERETSSPVAIKTTNRSIITDNGKIYNFDKVFDKATTQENLFDSALLYVRL